MIKFVLSLALMLSLCVCVQTQAAELSPENIVGHYKVKADAGIQIVYLNFHVLDTTEFEIQRTHPQGKDGEICNGTYTMDSVTTYVFSGVFSCPSNRSKTISFAINFKNKTLEDLANGTTVTVTSSLAPGFAVKAFLKRQ